MFSTDRIAWKGMIATLALMGFGGTVMAQTTIVRAGGPSARTYPVGKSLPASTKITLVAGDSLTVLDARGTRTLRGPGVYSATATAGTADKRNTFNSLVSTQNRRQARTGAVRTVRNGKVITHSPNAWLIDVRTSTTMCVANPASINFWRPDMEKVQTMTVRDDSTGKSTTVNWPVGRSETPWPTAVPANDGSSYTLQLSGTSAPVNVKLVNFGTQAAGDPATLAAALYERGCTAQLDLITARLEDSTETRQ